MATTDDQLRRGNASGLLSQIPTDGYRSAPAADGSSGIPAPSTPAASGGPLGRAIATSPQPQSPALPSIPASTPPNPTDQRLANGSQMPPPAPPSSIAPPAPASNQMMAGVFQHGRGQYSDSASGMGMNSSLGHPSAANVERADSLISRMNTSAPSASGGTPLAQAAGLIPEGGMAVLGSEGYGLRDPGALAERNALVSIGTLQAAKERAGDTWRKRGGQPGVARADVQLANFNRNREQVNELGNNLAMQGLRNSADLARTGMQEQGSNARTLLTGQDAMARTQVQEQGSNARTAMQTLGTVQAAQARADADGKGAPSGYRFKADGAGLEFIPGGPADPNTPKGKNNLNDVQAKALQFGTRMQQASQNLDTLAANGTEQPSLVKRAADAMGLGVAANWAQSPQQQQVEQSQRDFVNSVLRRESGAAISESEFDNARKQYFAQPGDSQQVIDQKQKNRNLATSGVLAEVPDQQTRVQQLLAATGSSVPPSAPVAARQGPSGPSPQVDELRRRAANNPALAQRLQQMGY